VIRVDGELSESLESLSLNLDERSVPRELEMGAGEPWASVLGTVEPEQALADLLKDVTVRYARRVELGRKTTLEVESLIQATEGAETPRNGPARNPAASYVTLDPARVQSPLEPDERCSRVAAIVMGPGEVVRE